MISNSSWRANDLDYGRNDKRRRTTETETQRVRDTPRHTDRYDQRDGRSDKKRRARRWSVERPKKFAVERFAIISRVSRCRYELMRDFRKEVESDGGVGEEERSAAAAADVGC